MEIIGIGAGIFVAVVLVVELISYGVRNMRITQRAKIRRRLRKYIYVETPGAESEITKKRLLSNVPFINTLLLALPGVKGLDRLTMQANAKQTVGFYLLSATVLAAFAFIVGRLISPNALLTFVLGMVGAIIPYFYLRQLKSKRIKRLKQQLPDGLDLIARALKAGHAFTGGMKLVSEEFDDPLGTEFSETLDEINYGVSVPEALKHMVDRVDCEEIKFFVVGVILQRETGGNLTELMSILSKLIRERFKFEGKVKVLTAEGRISALVLIALPILMAIYLWFINRKMIEILINEPAGQIMSVTMVILMIIGSIILKRMVNIKV